MSGSRYFVICVDDFSRHTWVFLMKSRSELLDIYRNFVKMVESQFSKPIKAFHFDNALEYTQHAFQNILKHYGTAPHLSCPGTSQQNERAERELRHILDTVLALLLSSLVPTHFWGEATLTAVYIINRLLTPLLAHCTPHERLFGSSPTYHQLCVFGFASFVLLQPHEFHEVGKFCIPSLPPFTTLLETPLSPSTTGDIFPESSSLEPQSSNAHDAPPLESPDSVQSEAPAHTSPPALRQSTRVKSLPSHLQDFHCFHALVALHEPHSYHEASTNPL